MRKRVSLDERDREETSLVGMGHRMGGDELEYGGRVTDADAGAVRISALNEFD